MRKKVLTMGNACGTIMARQANTTTHHTTLHRLFRKGVDTMKTYTITNCVYMNGHTTETRVNVDKETFYAMYLGYRRSGFHVINRWHRRTEWHIGKCGEKFAFGVMFLGNYSNLMVKFTMEDKVEYGFGK